MFLEGRFCTRESQTRDPDVSGLTLELQENVSLELLRL